MNNPTQDVDQQLKQLGERLALLLASSDMPDKVKEGWAALIPQMSLEQIDRLVGILEKQLSGAAESELRAFVEAVEQAKKAHAEKVQAAEKKAITELEEIEGMLQE